MLKGGYKFEVIQPFNEALSSMICDKLGLDHVHYDITTVKDKIVSKCECFINKDTELVTVYQIMHNRKKEYGNKDYETYIRILEDNRIEKLCTLLDSRINKLKSYISN